MLTITIGGKPRARDARRHEAAAEARLSPPRASSPPVIETTAVIAPNAHRGQEVRPRTRTRPHGSSRRPHVSQSSARRSTWTVESGQSDPIQTGIFGATTAARPEIDSPQRPALRAPCPSMRKSKMSASSDPSSRRCERHRVSCAHRRGSRARHGLRRRDFSCVFLPDAVCPSLIVIAERIACTLQAWNTAYITSKNNARRLFSVMKEFQFARHGFSIT